MVLHGSSTLKWAQTQLWLPSGYGDNRLLVPFSRVFGYRSVKQAQMQEGGLHISQPTSINLVSSVTEVLFPFIPVSFAYYMTDTS